MYHFNPSNVYFNIDNSTIQCYFSTYFYICTKVALYIYLPTHITNKVKHRHILIGYYKVHWSVLS